MPLNTELRREITRVSPDLVVIETYSETEALQVWLYQVQIQSGHDRLVPISELQIEKSARHDLEAFLEEQGLRRGAQDRRNEHVWSERGDEFVVWSGKGRVLRAERSMRTVCVQDQEPVSWAAIAGITSFVDETLEHRGVRIELRSGAGLTLAEERDFAAVADPTYDRTNLTIDAAWASYLGHALARWLGTPHTDQIG